MQWQASLLKPEDICFWGKEYIVYNHLTGETHLLDDYAGQILKN